MRGRPCSCAFTGHRPGKLPWGEDESDLRCIALKAKLRAAVESEAQKSRYRDILARCDYETMVQQSYTPGCMQRRNRYMVDHASLLIAVNDGARGGTRSTIEYAFKRGVNVLDIPLD